MNRVLLMTTVVLIFASSLSAAEEQVVFEDRFEGKPADGWTWLRENPKAWCIKDKALEICVEPGVAHNVKNALVREVPDRSEAALAFEVTVTFTSPPTRQYEQAGITWYNDGKPVFKLVKERIDGKTWIIPGRVAMPAKSAQLRLIVTPKGEYTAQFRPDGKGKFQTVKKGSLPPAKKDQVSIQCYNGPPDAQHWMRFDDFRILRLSD